MPGVPSNKACERCKRRHLKCDETRPHCQRCIAAAVECPGYVQTRKFIDQGATVRRRYAPYQEVHPAHATDSGRGQEYAQAAHIPNQPQVPDQISGISRQGNTTFQLQEAGLDTAGSPSQAIATTQTRLPVSGAPFSANLNSPRREGASSIARNLVSPSFPVDLTSPHANAYNADPITAGDQRVSSPETPSQRGEKEEFQDIFSEFMTGTEHEIAFLTRHYAEIIGPWLDLSDAGKFFSVYVPIRAINCPSLKYAIGSLAAKQLGRVKGAKSSAGNGMFTRTATTEVYPNPAQVDWFLKAANYYYMAASDLNNACSGGYTAVSSSAVLESPIDTVGRWLNSRSAKELAQTCSDGSLLRKAEEMLATVSLLTVYRLLDSNGEEWHKHLSGIRPLFESFLNMNLTGSTFFSHGIRASFWNFARQDYLGSYFTRSATHFVPTSLPLWRAAGILIDDQHKFQMGSIHLTQEDQAANGLSWLVSKVVNFLARSKESQIAQWTGSPPSTSPGGNQDEIPGSDQPLYPDTNTWLDLSFEFQVWFEGVPETFRPCVRIENPRDLTEIPDGPQLPFPEVFYSSSTCAAAMQHYHFGRIALLLNRPSDVVSAPSTAFDRLQGYRDLTKEVEYRSREVFGIAMGRPKGEVRVNMTPLLLAVGQCLESSDEHRIIVDLLVGVEADLGWATESVVQKLQASWNRGV
ncbi:uncharacterized protein N7484_006837 [Penicillium longicatenatum]|uniref:uncharacterized protein n=1 Tax=Penicillium longicatenatum TaxID=1561947 RepID=UPI002549B688|nr:uncharacterized protein N7484_006837 [Penicillium longicatenatum]KAJ5638975.1 hypothetical protein N7484_006837 [Penicillium longicatenatum]